MGVIQQNPAMDEILDEMKVTAPYLFEDERPDFDEFVEVFGPSLPKSTEISLSPHDTSIGIMTKGKGGEFIEKIRQYLKNSGMSEEGIEKFNRLERYFPDISLLMKREFDKEPGFDLTLYWQYLVPVHLLFRLASRFDTALDIIGFFKEASLLLRSRQVFLGLGFDPPDTVSYRIIFSTPHRKSGEFIAPALAALMAKVGVSAESINYFIGYHNFLNQVAKGSIFTSMGFVDDLPNLVKVDYEIIPYEHALQIMHSLNLPPEEGTRLRQAMDVMEMKRLTYLGIKFLPGRLPLVKFYLDRRYSRKNEDNAELLADFITNTIWTP